MKKTQFKLSVPFSLHNKVCILEIQDKKIKFGLVNDENQNLKELLRKNVRRFYHLAEKEIPDACKFEKIDDEKLKKIVSFSYGKSEPSAATGENEKDKKNPADGTVAKNHADENASAILLDSLLEQACVLGASDIHIEENLVRFRVEGVLEKICVLSAEKGRELVRRVKVLSKLDLIETRRAQDGQFVYKRRKTAGFGKNDEKNCGIVFVRVSCVPAVSRFYLENDSGAENIALRLLDVERQPLSIEKLGFLENQVETLKRISLRKSGLVLICGATGSGKSTTAASLISEISKASGGSKKIISVEDPPEYALENVTQIKVDESLGMSFSSALRFVFRQDPDVIFIGEIRDEISAKTALQASLTGHLVIATVHSGGIFEAVLRMKELAPDSSSLETVLCEVIFQTLEFRCGKPNLTADFFDFKCGDKFLQDKNLEVINCAS